MPFNRGGPLRRPFPEADLGLYHGVKPKKVWKVKAPKLPGWTPSVHKKWMLPNIFPSPWHFPSLGKTLLIKTSTQARRAIDLAGGIEPYILNTKPEKLGVVGMKLRIAVTEALAEQKRAHLDKTKAAYLAQHPAKPHQRRWIHPKPVVVWSWLQDAEANELTRACIRCGSIGHTHTACSSPFTSIGTPCSDQPLHDVHSGEASTSSARHICSSYHQLGQCDAQEPCDEAQVGVCPICNVQHPAYEHVVDGLRSQGINIDYRPTPVESLPDTEQQSVLDKGRNSVWHALDREEAIARNLLRVRNLDALAWDANERWLAAGQPSLDHLQPTGTRDVDTLKADMESLGIGDELLDARDKRHIYSISQHLRRPAVTVVPM